jgi:NADPH:quinone reductase-like Zn-dependent oxidoreductase
MKMKAIVYEKYGTPEVLHFKEVEKPVPKDGEVLIKIFASSVNVEDLDYLKGNSWAVRMLGPFKPKYKKLGFDVAGQVEAVGQNVKQFQVGDEVIGELFGHGFGAFAEYVCAPEKILVPKPTNMTFEEAATVPSRALLALQGLRGKRPVRSGQKVLINGAGGGVGPFAVQIAKYFGAEVAAVDCAKKLDMLRSLGADHVIDYAQEDFTKNGQHYDLILDVAGHHSVFAYRRSLSQNGLYSIVGGSRSTLFQVVFIGSLLSLFGSKKMGIIAWKQNKTEDLNFILDLIESGKLTAVIDRCYPLNEVPQAMRYFAEGAPIGKIVIAVDHNTSSTLRGTIND